MKYWTAIFRPPEKKGLAHLAMTWKPIKKTNQVVWSDWPKANHSEPGLRRSSVCSTRITDKHRMESIETSYIQARRSHQMKLLMQIGSSTITLVLSVTLVRVTKPLQHCSVPDKKPRVTLVCLSPSWQNKSSHVHNLQPTKSKGMMNNLVIECDLPAYETFRPTRQQVLGRNLGGKRKGRNSRTWDSLIKQISHESCSKLWGSVTKCQKQSQRFGTSSSTRSLAPSRIITSSFWRSMTCFYGCKAENQNKTMWQIYSPGIFPYPSRPLHHPNLIKTLEAESLKKELPLPCLLQEMGPVLNKSVCMFGYRVFNVTVEWCRKQKEKKKLPVLGN